jgi:tripartite-type tricarboxylate transporter receptor subunit TctC
MVQRRQLLVAGAAAALGMPFLRFAQAAEPLAQVKILCGFPPGGTTDMVSRRVADKLRANGYAKVVLVENRAGVGGRLAVEELRRQPADGTAMLLTPASMVTLYPHIYTRLSYRHDDVTPVCTACNLEFGFGVGPAVPDSVKTLPAFLDWARANPAKANYGSPGAGTPPHFVGALLARDSGIDLQHIAYKGSAPGIQDLLGGQVTAFSSPIGDYLQYLKAGRLRLLATSGPVRTPFTPDVPTYAEQGFKRLTIGEWYGFFLPGGARPDVVERSADAIRQAVTAPDVVDAFAQFGLVAGANRPAEQLRAVQRENADWGPIVKTIGFSADN